MDGLLNDFRHGLRMLIRTPLLSIVAILTMGLGVGAVAFGSSVVYAILFRGPPVRDVERLMAVEEIRREDGDEEGVPLKDYHELRAAQTTFEQLGAFYSGTVNVAGEEGPPERYDGAFVTADLLSMLGVRPLLGRTFREGEDVPGAPALVVLAHDAWTARFAGDPALIGRTLRVNGEPAEVIGVMPEGFRFPMNQQIWVNHRVDPAPLSRRGGQSLQVAGYLRPGATEEGARSELAAVGLRLEAEHPENEGIAVNVRSFASAFVPPEIVMIMGVLMAMVGGVLLVACANVANVLLARGVVREREVAVRTALGADRWRVVRQLLVEAVVLGIAGGLVGIIIASVSLDLFEASVRDVARPYWMVFHLDAPGLIVTTLVTFTAAVGAGIWPALRASGGDAGTILRDEGRGSSSLRVGRFTNALVVGELAVSCGLMIAAGLMAQALVSINRLDLGFDPRPVMTARVGLFEGDYPDVEARARFYSELRDRLAAEPGVEAATVSMQLPATGQGRVPLELDGATYATPADRPRTGFVAAGVSFFETFGVPVVEGREFEPSETAPAAEPVAVVSQSFATRHLGPGSPLGQRIRVGEPEGDEELPWRRIVGVVADVHPGVGAFGGSVGEAERDAVYVPLGQQDARFVSIAVRTRSDPQEAGALLRRAVTAQDGDLPLYWLRTLREAIDQNATFHRIFGSLFIIFGTSALFLAAVGLYGVMDFSVASRTREMGVRTALGANRAAVLRLVLLKVGLQLGIGALLGVGLGLLLAMPLSSTLFGVPVWDPLVYGVIVGTLVLTGLAATLAPAIRAVRVDPVVALRA